MDLDISKSKVNIKPGAWGKVDISFNGRIYKLSHSGKEWNVYDSVNNREVYEQYSSYDLAYGDVLLTGFGFGHISNWIASKPEVTSVTILEISQDILDAYLESNVLPEKTSVIITDADTYKSDKKYDCVILDHISNQMKPKSFYLDFRKIAKNIKNDLFWFWSIEMFYLKHYYNFTLDDLYKFPKDFKPFDFGLKWENFRKDFGIDTIPSLDKPKLDSYINAFFLRHLIQE